MLRSGKICPLPPSSRVFFSELVVKRDVFSKGTSNEQDPQIPTESTWLYANRIDDSNCDHRHSHWRGGGRLARRHACRKRDSDDPEYEDNFYHPRPLLCLSWQKFRHLRTTYQGAVPKLEILR